MKFCVVPQCIYIETASVSLCEIICARMDGLPKVFQLRWATDVATVRPFSKKKYLIKREELKPERRASTT